MYHVKKVTVMLVKLRFLGPQLVHRICNKGKGCPEIMRHICKEGQLGLRRLLQLTGKGQRLVPLPDEFLSLLLHAVPFPEQKHC